MRNKAHEFTLPLVLLFHAKAELKVSSVVSDVDADVVNKDKPQTTHNRCAITLSRIHHQWAQGHEHITPENPFLFPPRFGGGKKKNLKNKKTLSKKKKKKKNSDGIYKCAE